MNMKEQDIIKIWKQGSDKSGINQPITMETIENIAAMRSGKASKKIRWDLYFGLGANLTGLVLTICASVLYMSHIYLRLILPALCLILVLLTIHNVKLIREHKKLSVLNISLREMVSGIIRYFNGSYRLWQLLYPFGMMILVFSFTILMDYEDGTYRINHPGEFVAILVIMYAFMYIPLRYTGNVFVKDLENCLKNMDELEYTSISKVIRRHRIFLILFATGLALLVLGGIALWLSYSGKI